MYLRIPQNITKFLDDFAIGGVSKRDHLLELVKVEVLPQGPDIVAVQTNGCGHWAISISSHFPIPYSALILQLKTTAMGYGIKG
jgi:hypothetical protein